MSGRFRICHSAESRTLPELPEVETTRRGIAPHLQGQHIAELRVRQWRLRWPIPRELPSLLAGQPLGSLARRGKYLLFGFPSGTAILHLGMSGSLRLLSESTPPGKHDHVDFILGNATALRYTDPRRFGALLWTADDPAQHPLLRDLGPEPLGESFDGDYLFRRSRNRRVSSKAFIMDSKVVVGVGNIYANEALFMAGLRPGRAAGRLSRAECVRLAEQIKAVLNKAI